MKIQTTFCPRCGAPTEEEGLCPACRVADTRWMICEPRVTAVSCPTCESLKRGKTWSDLRVEREDLIGELALSAVTLHEDVKNPRSTVRHEEMTQNRTACTIDIDATLYSIPVHGTCQTEIAWQRETCDRCGRISGGYYEGVVQVRATDRKINGYEREVAASIANQAEEALQEAGDRLSFVSSIDESRDGVDIVVGSQHLGQTISQMITGALGGRYTTHPKLVGEKDGKALYRVTYSIRLPFYQKGDVVAVKGNYFEVRDLENKRLKVFDLQTGSTRTIAETDVERQIGNVREAESAIVAFIQGKTVGLLDPKTYRTREVNAVPWFVPLEGQPTRVLRDEERDVLVIIG
jgi:nonsense-mediated mRNA decay protein 3